MKIFFIRVFALLAFLIGLTNCQSTTTETPLKKPVAPAAPQPTKNNFLQTMVEKSIKLYNLGKPAALINICNRDNVSCYINAKMYPADKPMTDGLYHQIALTKTYKLKAKTSQKLDITIYESKK